MSKTWFDTFTLVINFINDDWVPCHSTLELFETFDAFGITLIKQPKSLLVEYQFINKIVIYVKDEGTNFNSLGIVLTLIMSYAFYNLFHILVGLVLAMWCHMHVIMTQIIIRLGLGHKGSWFGWKFYFIKNYYMNKKFNKGRQKWELTCKEIGMRPRKLKTLIKKINSSKVVLFQKTMEFSTTINLRYRWYISKLQPRIPLTWTIVGCHWNLYSHGEAKKLEPN